MSNVGIACAALIGVIKPNICPLLEMLIVMILSRPDIINKRSNVPIVVTYETGRHTFLVKQMR